MGVFDEVGVNFVAYHDIRSWIALADDCGRRQATVYLWEV
jgi:hypothetical protein